MEPLTYLDPDYQDFVPGRSKLKASTFNSESRWRSCVTWFVLAVLCLLALLMIAASMAATRVAIQFAVSGEKTTAEVDSCQMVFDQGGDHPLVVYHYTVEGRRYENDTTPTARSCDDYRPGSTLEIAYLPHQPEVSQRTDENPLVVLLFMGIAVVGLFALGAVFRGRIQAERQGNRVQNSLNSRGQLLNGTVVRVEPPRAASQGIKPAVVHYQFDTPAGKRVEGRMNVYSTYDAVKPLESGTPVRVLYANDRTHIVL